MKFDGNQLKTLHYITYEMKGMSPVHQAVKAFENGCKVVQLRMKANNKQEIEKTVNSIISKSKPFNAILIVNDFPDIALECGAAGVHLGKNDMHPSIARGILGESAIIGGTADNFERIVDIAPYVDYIGLGPFRFTTTKGSLSPIIGIEGYKRILAQCKEQKIIVPILGIGGVNIDDAKSLILTGLDGLAVSSAIACAPDPAEMIRRFIKKIETELLKRNK